MRAVLRLAAHKLRTRWRGWVFLVLLVGLAGGAVLTAAAGALRTDSAYPRFLEKSKASDVLVSPAASGLGGYYNALARLPDVAAIAPIVGLQAAPIGPGGLSTTQRGRCAAWMAGSAICLRSRRCSPGASRRRIAPNEVAVDQIAAADLHLRVGSRLELGAAAGTDTRHIRLLSERVVGIMVTRGSVVPVTVLDQTPVILASTALFRELGPRYLGFDGAYVKLRPGAGLGGFSRLAQELAPRFPATGGQVFVADEAAQAASVERAIRPQAVALALFALVLAVTGLLVVGQVASRLMLAAAQDNRTLAALGMTRGQLLAAGLVEVGLAAAAGAAVACGVAIAASPLMPIGPARLAEPDPGVSVNAAVLAAGFAAITALLLARVAWPAWRQASARLSAEHDAAGTQGRRSRAAGWLARSGAPVTAVTGVRFALDPGQGRTAVPVRSALLGTVLAVTAVAAAVTFGANLLHLVDTPSLYGQDWDVAVDLQFQHHHAAAVRRAGGACSRHLRLDVRLSWHAGDRRCRRSRRSAWPRAGVRCCPRPCWRAARRSRIERLCSVPRCSAVSVCVSGSRCRSRRAVTGSWPGSSAVPSSPYFGEGSFTPTDVGQGAQTTAALLAPQAGAPANGGGYSFVLVRFAPGTRQAADVAAFQRAMGPFCATVQQSTCVVTDQRPNAVANYALIDATPDVLAGILAVLGLAVLGQFVVASGRRRRRDFAIMKVLGLLRRQVSAVTVWQVTTLTGLALLVGLPLGVAGGHWAWELFAGNVGLATDAITPLPLLWTIPVTLVAASLIALRPGQIVARLSPAAVLRSE